MIGSLNSARSTVNSKVYNMGGNTFEKRIDLLIKQIENQIQNFVRVNKKIKFLLM